jgi:Flp pilus assembly protein TadG
MRPRGPARRSRRGVTAIEAALILPVLFLMLFGVFDWSWYLFHWLTVNRASHACVRIAAGLATAEDPLGAATTAARDWLDAYVLDGSAAQVDVSLAGDVLTCQVTVPFEPLVGLVPAPEQLVAAAETSWYGHVFDPD